MNKRNPLTIIVGLVLLLIFVLLLFVFQVRTTEVAVVTTFGKATRPITQAGAYLKWPWPIQRVHHFDQRTHNFESKFEQVLTPDNYNLLISVYVGWKISQPDIFFPRFSGLVERAEESLEGLVRNASSGVVGQHPLSHFVTTNEKELQFEQIEQEMLKRVKADAEASGYGMEIKFLGIKRLGFPESVTETVFKRMQSERELQEKTITAEAENAASVIRSGANLESAKILAEADAQATRIRGMGEMEAAKSFEVFQKNPELANFLLELNGLELFLKDRTTLILDESTPPLRLLKPLAAPAKKDQ